MIDPELYLESYEILERYSHPSGSIDLYFDVLGLVAERNRRRIMRGKESIYNVSPFQYANIDYGTPEKLRLVRQIYPSVPRKDDNQV